MSDIRSLEHPTLKVPYENLNKRFRSAQKVIDKEASYLTSAVADLEKLIKDGDDDRLDQFIKGLDVLAEKAAAFQDKTKEAVHLETSAAVNCKVRLDHLKSGCSLSPLESNGNTGATSTSQLSIWRKTRLDRMLVEHFLRSGFYDTAGKLAEAAGISDLTNISVFLVAKEVEEALSKRDTAKCLSWCYDNKSKLKKMKSQLEFDVRLQEFVELIKTGKTLEAVKHARKYLSACEPDQIPAVQRASALLAYPKGTEIQVYQEMFREDRWHGLIEQFRHENYRLFQLSTQSVLSVALQTGLSALKTQKCSSPTAMLIDEDPASTASSSRECNKHTECPVCQPPLTELAGPLPYAHCSQSRLICYISGKPLNENNQPMMLPNGFVYGEQAMMRMSMENDGRIVCPRTKEIYPFSQLEKVYVM